MAPFFDRTGKNFLIDSRLNSNRKQRVAHLLQHQYCGTMSTSRPLADSLVCTDCLFSAPTSEAHLYETKHKHLQQGFPIKDCTKALFPFSESGYQSKESELASLNKRIRELGGSYNQQLRAIENDIKLLEEIFKRYQVSLDPVVSDNLFHQIEQKQSETLERKKSEIGAIKVLAQPLNDDLSILKSRRAEVFAREKYWKRWKTDNYLLIDNAHVNYERITTVTADDVSKQYFCDHCRKLISLVQTPPYFVAAHQNCPNSNKQLTRVDLMTVSEANQKYPGNPDLKRPWDLGRDGHPG